ncbi:uncharacterized protein LOC111687264 [Lucilia cuprina]|uniref:uncharacterized protein LOC111687264 n=1 Tax=Lucilia cuprina TaxID=7375 RepID=UPI001F06BD56|nr:uncharacterized protein LOC111687264 [Lucilia cuprina]XP_046801703.1 uncharacterized protein LOC111687264 [Lucilia cuprina]
MPRNNNISRTKEEKAKNGIKKSLAFLAKMSKKDPSSLTSKEKHLIRRHRQDVSKFERIYGPVCLILGRSYLGEQNETAVSLTNTIISKGSATSSTNCSMGNGGIPNAEELRSSERAAGSYEPTLSEETNEFKITRMVEKVTEKHLAKKAKKGENIDKHLQAAIVNRNNRNGKFNNDIWQIVESKLLDEIANFNGSSEDVSFNGADWYKGIKIVNCGNKNSLDFLKTTIDKLNQLNPHLNLDVIHASELPLRSIVTVWIPPPILTVETILNVLAKQNTKLLTHQWRFVTSLACKENSGRDFRFAVDQKSLEYLEEVSGVANFGLGTVKFRVPKRKNKEASGGAEKSTPI